ncbi:MAG: hypothetical protein JWQ57_3810, partial [Mucilaginibacter sp.]|nr:hypothetical protein [Mucilaginibacter sp.]
ISAVSNFSELFQNFYQKADSKKYAGKANKLKCFARMARYETDANGRIEKAGGGLRVSKIYIDDNWGTINSPGKAVSGLYGQSYDYTTIENGQAISSGVATYEPHVGSDENPFKLPVPYTQQIKGGLNNYFDMEEPFGESVFPAPMVTYAKVTVRDLIKGGASVVNDAGQRTGYMVNEYYTSRDFPVKVNVLPINTIHNKPSSYFSFIKTMSDDELYMSQGYSIQLNDMNGKLKSTKTYDQSNALIASTEYFYKCDDTGGNEFTLNNNVKVLNQNGSVTNNIIGQEIEMFTDFREQESVNTGTTVNVGVDLINFGPIGLYLPHVPIEANDDYSLFRSACSLKVIQSYGVLDRVVSRVNGSNITTQNIAFDGLTGSPLITKTQNEFNKDIYAVTIPAYWAYPGMGPAYPNQGVMLSGLSADGTGKLNSSFYSYLNSGDEVLDLDPAKQNVSGSDYGQRFWVVEQIRATTPTNTGAYLPGSGNYNVAGATGVTSIKYLMDRWGQIKKSYSSALVKIVRAGSRNMINGEIAKIVCLNNPIGTDNNLQLKNNTDLTTALKVINASAVTYDEIWAAEPPDIHIVENTTQNWQLSTVSLTGATFVPSIESYTVKPPSSEDISNWPLQGANWGARLAICGIKPANDAIFAANGSLDIYTTFTAPTTSNPFGFLVGYASTSGLDFDIDCGTYRFSNSVFIPTSYGWLIQPMYITLTPGIHNLHIHLSKGLVTNPALMAAGVEIYNNTMLDMYNSTIGQAPSINPIFSTSSLQNAAKVNESITYGSDSPIYRYNWTDYLSTPNAPCINQANVKAINPYTYGYRGNWRPYQSKVYQQNRVYNSILNQTNNAVDIKNAGYIDAFFSNWYYLATANSGKGLWTQNPNATRWTTASTVTLYDKYGQQLENMDALNRFSTAEFDFNGQLPAAVATNARNREIYSNTFEDAYFVPGGTIYVDANTLPEFTQVSSGQPISKFITNGIAHSGKSSVLLPQDGLTLTTKAYAGSQSKYLYLDYDSSNQYQKNTTLNGLYPNGFEPAPAPGYYLMNVWVKDINIDNKSTIPVTIAVNGAAATDIKIKAVVEDWKLVEAKLDLRAFTNGAQVKIAITPVAGSTPVYVDDLRIHPYDSEMKTFVYDKSSLRLMAQLDENGFATFYEYDSQGQLIRVKKETEKGVVTLKESRSSYIKNTQ